MVNKDVYNDKMHRTIKIYRLTARD